LYPGYYLPKDRAQRINGLLESKSNWTSKEVQKMINDNTSATASDLMLNWTSVLSKKGASNEQKAIQILQNWKGTNDLKDVAPTIFNKWLYFYLQDTFKDELGEDHFNAFLGTHIMKQTIAAQSQNPNSPWWDDVATKNRKETRDEILNKSFQQAVASLENNWELM